MINPSISILLTTYKRPQFLKLAIRSVLRQDFKKFELIILDDASKDDTSKVVESFGDKRIRYVRNSKNLGFPGNFRHGVKLAKGELIFLLSDDDLVVYPNTLSHIYKKMKSSKSSFGQLGLMFYDEDFYRPYLWATPHRLKTKVFPHSKDILLKTIDWHFGFASGNIYKRSLLRQDDIINDVWFSHVRPIYRIVSRGNAIYFGDHFILGRISKSGNVSYLNIDVNKEFHMEKMFSLYKEFDSSKRRLDKFKKVHLEDGAIRNFAGIKYYTSSDNLIKTARSVLSIESSYGTSPFFWFHLLSALITPKILLDFVRRIKVNRSSIKMARLVARLNFQSNIKDIIK